MEYMQKDDSAISARIATLFIVALSVALLAGCGYASDPAPSLAPSPEPLTVPYAVGARAEIRDDLCVGEVFVALQGSDDLITTGIACSMNGVDLPYVSGSPYYTATLPGVEAGDVVEFSIDCGAGNVATVTAIVPDAPSLTSPVPGGSYVSGNNISVSWNTAMTHPAASVYIAAFRDGTLFSTLNEPFADGTYEFIGGFSPSGPYELTVSATNSTAVTGVNFYHSSFCAANRSSVAFSVN